MRFTNYQLYLQCKVNGEKTTRNNINKNPL